MTLFFFYGYIIFFIQEKQHAQGSELSLVSGIQVILVGSLAAAVGGLLYNNLV